MAAYLRVIDVEKRAESAIQPGTRTDLDKDKITVGRHPDCDLVIDLPDVSRFHYSLTRDQRGYVLHAHWLNPTTLNGKVWSECVADIDDGWAVLEDGDRISFDLLQGEIRLHVSDEELGRRREQWRAPSRSPRRGYLADFAATVLQANHGCVSGALHKDA